MRSKISDKDIKIYLLFVVVFISAFTALFYVLDFTHPGITGASIAGLDSPKHSTIPLMIAGLLVLVLIANHFRK